MKNLPVKPKDLSYTLAPEGFDERLEGIQRLTKRMAMLMREVEVYSLDMTLYSKSLARGSMPRSYVEEVAQTIDKAGKELNLIAEAWRKTFKEIEIV